MAKLLRDIEGQKGERKKVGEHRFCSPDFLFLFLHVLDIGGREDSCSSFGVSAFRPS